MMKKKQMMPEPFPNNDAHGDAPSDRLTRLIGAILLCLMFFVSGIHKIFKFTSTKESLLSKIPSWPLPRVSIAIVIMIEILCPILIIYSLLYDQIKTVARASLIAMITFVVIVTCIYHPLDIKKKYMSNVAFFSNLSVTGGLLTLYSAL